MVLIVINTNQDFLDFQGFQGFSNCIRSTIISLSLLGFLIQRDDIDAKTNENQGCWSWGVR
jgi:hypothetical protein